MLLALLLSCSTDVSIMKRHDPSVDTNSALIDTSVTSEPSDERSGITGYNYLHLRQVACPTCMGETQEISITFQGESSRILINSVPCYEKPFDLSYSSDPLDIAPWFTFGSRL